MQLPIFLTHLAADAIPSLDVSATGGAHFGGLFSFGRPSSSATLAVCTYG